MRILVTGGAGHIGSHMVLKLLDHGYFVAVVDNLSTGSREALHKDASFLHACVSDNTQIAKLIRDLKIDTIMHFAGSVSIPQSISQPMQYYENNVLHAYSLLQTAIHSKVKRFIFSSTAAVYEQSTGVPISEDHPLNPIAPYGNSKMMFETMLKDASSVHDISFAILRYFNVAGADPSGRSKKRPDMAANLINTVCKAAAGKSKTVSIFGDDYDTRDGTCIRDFIHVWDLVEAHRLALKRLAKTSENLVLNCGTGRGVSVHEVVTAVESVSSHTFQREILPRRPGDLPQVIADITKIKTLLDWRPQYRDIENIICHELARN